MKNVILSLAFAHFLFVPALLQAESAKEVYVQSRFAEIKSEPTMDSKTLGLSAIGEKLVQIGKDSTGTWVKVRNARGEGWVPKFSVTTKSLESLYKAQKDLQSKRAIAKKMDRANSRAPASTGPRGKKVVKNSVYTPAVKTSGLINLDLNAIEKLDQFKVSSGELKKFQKTGKLTTN